MRLERGVGVRVAIAYAVHWICAMEASARLSGVGKTTSPLTAGLRAPAGSSSRVPCTC